MEIQTSQIIQSIQNKFIDSNVASAMIDIKTLAASPLKPLDYQRVSRLIDEYRSLLLSYLGGKPLKLAILGGYTTQPISVSLRTFLLAEGCLADIYESEYNSYKMEVLNPESGLYVFKPDIVLFATGSMNIDTFPALGSTIDEVESAANAFVEEYRHLWSTVKERIEVPVIQHNFEPLEKRILGRLEYKYPWSRSRFKQRINERFWELDGKDVYILDVYGLTVRIGVHNWFDPRWYYHGKYGYNPDLAFEYGRLFTGLYRAIVGKAKKCLVTDLDNTLWGGIVGDDGVHGIHLGNISSQGEAYKAFCNYLKALKNRGVILAVCSKNDPILAKEVFTQHPEMPLDLDDFAAFCCNWESKSLNLRGVAKGLNIGTDALVYIDDNPVECAEVREMMPEVSVIEMGGDPAYFIRKLNQQHLFDQLDITNEDFKRSATYAVQHKISVARKFSPSLKEFLVNLEMVGRFCPAGPEDVPRIEQMFKKTNQFNLTSRRYERAAILQFINDEKSFCLPGWLKDRFANYGLVSVVVGDIKEGNLLQISNWVMSCRVFSRTFEQYIFNQLKAFAEKQGCSGICGEFVPTAKNGYVKELYSKLGFTSESNRENGLWFLHLLNAPEIESYVTSEQA